MSTVSFQEPSDCFANMEMSFPTSANGHSDFGVLQTELGAKRSDKIVFYAFDLL